MEQKPIGLIGAMKIEVDAILAALENTRQETHGGMAFTQASSPGWRWWWPSAPRQGERRPVRPGHDRPLQPPAGAEPGGGRRHWGKTSTLGT